MEVAEVIGWYMNDGVSIQQASKKFWVSERTIWNWIKSGKLSSVKVKKGNKYHTVITDSDTEKDASESTTEPSEGIQDTLTKQITFLQEQLVEKDKQLAEQRQLITQQQLITRDLQARLPMLEAPKDSEVVTEGVAEDTEHKDVTKKKPVAKKKAKTRKKTRKTTRKGKKPKPKEKTTKGKKKGFLGFFRG